MRWLLLKDLQILKRSPLLVGVLVAYSVVVSLVAGAALSSGPSKPKVAFANLVPEDKSEVALGGRSVDATQYADKLFAKVDPIRVKTREEAIAKVKSGEALGALVTHRLRLSDTARAFELLARGADERGHMVLKVMLGPTSPPHIPHAPHHQPQHSHSRSHPK